MKKFVIAAVVIVAGLAGVAYYTGVLKGESAAQPTVAPGGAAGRGGFPAGGGRGRGRGGGPMTVEVATAHRATIAQELTVVGNLIGEATVSVAPRAAGRVQEVYVRLGDQVSRGQQIARIEDFELQEQLKQAEAAQEVAQATIRQREADLALARTNVERSRSLFERQLLPKQTLDDNEARYQSAQAQLDLARAQAVQSKARLDELKINLANTIVTSPVNGFISRRVVDVGASVNQNAPVVDVVDISRVRLVANVIEKDLRELEPGDPTRVQVDAYPGETFVGRIARISPVLDPATRTAPIEIEIPNPNYRLKPGMYARVSITLDTTKDALVVPANAVVDLGGRRGVFQPLNETAVFRFVQVGVEQRTIIEILGGLAEGAEVITTGAAALRDGDPIVIAGGDGAGPGLGRPAGGEGGIVPPASGEALAPRGDGERLGPGAGAPRPGFAPGDAAPADGAAGSQPGGRRGREGFPGGRDGFSGQGRRGQAPADAPQQ